MKKLIIGIMTLCLCTGCGDKETDISSQQQVAAFVHTAELSTVEYTVTKIVKADDVPEWYKIGDRKILFSCKAHLKAGVDLQKVTEKDVVVSADGKSVTLTLPKAKLLSLSINPQDVKLVCEDVDFFRSRFTADDRNKLLIQGEEDIRMSSVNLGILEDAENNAQQYFETMLKSLGYQNATINFK